MTDEFYVLRYSPDDSKGYCIVDQLSGFEDKWLVSQGVSLAANPPSKLTMSMSADEPRRTILPDYVENTDRLLIVSPRMRTFLESLHVNNVEYYPLEIKDHKGKVASDAYFVAHLINPVDCIDPDASGVTWTSEGLPTQRILFLDKLVIDSARVPSDRKLFFSRYYNKVPVVRQELAEAMHSEGLSNIETVPLSEFEG